MNNIIETIKNSKFSNDSELANTVRILESNPELADSIMIPIMMKSTLKRIATLESDSINLPTNLFNSYECSLIEDFMLDNEWSKSDINDSMAYKGKYFIHYRNPNEQTRICFFKQDDDLFAEVGDDLIQL